MGSINILGEQFERTSVQWFQTMFSSRISFLADTDYCLAVKAIGAANINLGYYTIPTANLSKFLTIGGTGVKKATRNNGSGAFTLESPAVTMYEMGLRVYPSGGGGGGGSTLYGMVG
jgi:hypothetical protein